MISYWLTAPKDPQLDEIIVAIYLVHNQARHLSKQEERTVSTDEIIARNAMEFSAWHYDVSYSD